MKSSIEAKNRMSAPTIDDTNFATQSQAQLSTNLGTNPQIYARSVACNYACMQFETQSSTHSARPLCPQGLSDSHINILSIIKDNRLPMSFREISELLHTYFEIHLSEGAVRGIIERLKKNKLIASRLARFMHRRGNLYSFSHLVCEHIPSFEHFTSRNQARTLLNSQASSMSPMQSAQAQNGMYVHTQEEANAHLSILKEIDRKNLSILKNENAEQKLEALTEDDIAFHFPNLHAQGFGTQQIRQINHRLLQVELDCSQVMQGLIHAEWELENDLMRDKDGKAIQSPLNWVFRILAKQGYYPRPKGYVSPKEQAKLDETLELERVRLAYEETRQASFDDWHSKLSEPEKQKLFEENTTYRHANPRIILKDYFFANIYQPDDGS